MEQIEISKFKKIALIYNRNSGRQLFGSKKKSVEVFSGSLCKSYGAEKLQFWTVEKFADLEAIAARIVAERVEWVIIAAGDGTIRSLVERVVDKGYRPYFSIYPVGTVNLVAKELQIPGNPTKWLRRVSRGLVYSVYAGRASGNLFLTVAGIGFDSLIVQAVTETSKKYLNKLAYVWQGSRMFFREMLRQDWRYKFQVSLDGGPWRSVSTILVGKSKYYAGRYQLFDNISISDDFFHVALLYGGGAKDFLRYSVAIGRGTIARDKTVDIATAREIVVRCNVDGFPVELDGDAVTAAPVKIFMDNEPLKFLV